MARKKLSDELKIAISELSHKEKNKLLNRLIAKDEVLTEQLTFQLLENSSTTQFRRSQVSENILSEIEEVKRSSPRQMTSTIRRLSAQITRHVRVTKDKYGEIELNVLLVRTCMDLYNEMLAHAWGSKVYKLREYLIKKIIRVSKLSQKIHPDYLIDFEEWLSHIGEMIQDNIKMKDVCAELDVNTSTLLSGEFL